MANENAKQRNGKYTVDTFIRVWDDKSGTSVQVGPDRDGLDLCEVVVMSDDGHPGPSVVMTAEQAVLVAHAILKLYEK